VRVGRIGGIVVEDDRGDHGSVVVVREQDMGRVEPLRSHALTINAATASRFPGVTFARINVPYILVSSL
jgi:hypothetical protein